MIGLTTGRRLHFGLFTPVPVPGLDFIYGGVGAMVDVPGITLQAEPAESWSAEGQHSGRVQQILERLHTHAGPAPSPHVLRVTYAAPAHQGWGTGTQLALVVARLWSYLADIPWSAREASHWTGRGVRSGVGIAGFDHPGAIFDFGKQPSRPAATSKVNSIQLPPEWTWLLVEPRGETGLHAEEERSAFARLPPPAAHRVTELKNLSAKLSLDGSHMDFTSFAETLTAYNRIAGSLYASVQGGDYGSPLTAERIAHLQAHGVRGVGQSSWGPGLFALFPDKPSALAIKSRLKLPHCTIHLGHTACTSPQVDLSPATR